jgi:energy-coupling factor transporter ATP-binding protein EcfA2
MNESPREKQLLDSLTQGKSVTIGRKIFASFPSESVKILNYFRTLSHRDLEPPLGKDKLDGLVKWLKSMNKTQTNNNSSQQIPNSVSNSGKKFKVKSINAQNFRGLQYYGGPLFSYVFEQKSYLFTGPNGAGKSSILNAVVWALTGQLLWDREQPSSPQNVDLKYFYSGDELKTIKSNWPSHISLPDLSNLKAHNPRPFCWVEVCLISEDGQELKVRRETNPEQGEKFSGLSTIDPVSIDLSLLMPGRINHIKFDENSEIGKLLIQISGLEAIDTYGIYASSKGIGFILTRSINESSKNITEFDTQVKTYIEEAKRNIPNDLIEKFQSSMSTEKSRTKNIEITVDWLNLESAKRLKELIKLLNLSKEPTTQELIELAKNILVVYENIKDKNSLNWNSFKTLSQAASGWNENIERQLNIQLESAKNDFQTAIEWYKKQRETENLKLKLVASQLIKSMEEPEKCPLCDLKLPDTHPLRKELLEYRNAGDLAIKSIIEIVSILKGRLLKALPENVIKIASSSLKELTIQEYHTYISNILNGSLVSLNNQGEKNLLTLFDQEIIEESAMLAPELIESDIGISFTDAVNAIIDEQIKESIELFIDFEKELNNKIKLVKWAKTNIVHYLEIVDLNLGYSNTSEPSSVVKVIEQANNIASSGKPLQEAVKLLQLAKELDIKQNTLLEDKALLEKVKEDLKPLEKLKDLADLSLIEDIKGIERELYVFYDRLYGGDEFDFKKVTWIRNGRNTLFSFLVEYRDILVEVSPFLNSSRIRAILWSYMFALTKVGPQYFVGDWLDFTIIDDPLTSLDIEHQRSFAQIVFDKSSSHQNIVSSHDLRWPKELQRLKLNISLEYRSCYGLCLLRDVICIDEWKSILQKKWNDWKSDETDIEKGRDYVDAARIWCEEELKCLLLWASEPSLPHDNLNPLLKKLEKAFTNNPIYNIAQINLLCPCIREIETDLQNSHHGCVERNNIFKNEVNVVQKHMEKIIQCIEIIHETLSNRKGLSCIT